MSNGSWGYGRVNKFNIECGDSIRPNTDMLADVFSDKWYNVIGLDSDGDPYILNDIGEPVYIVNDVNLCEIAEVRKGS